MSQKQKQKQKQEQQNPIKWLTNQELTLTYSLGDGNCFFDSMQQLIRNCPAQNKEQALILRRQVVESMRSSIENIDNSVINSINGLLKEQNFRDVHTFENYFNKMCRDGIYADEIEIAQTAKLYQCVIWVYNIYYDDKGKWIAPTQSHRNSNWPIRYPQDGGTIVSDNRPVYRILRRGEHFQPLFTKNALEAYKKNGYKCTSALVNFPEYQCKQNESSLGVLFMVILGAAGLGVLVGFNT
jgi:hypothetical protein